MKNEKHKEDIVHEEYVYVFLFCLCSEMNFHTCGTI